MPAPVLSPREDIIGKREIKPYLITGKYLKTSLELGLSFVQDHREDIKKFPNVLGKQLR